MKESPYHGVPFVRYLKKFLLDLKILILVLLLGASNALSGFDLQQITVSGTVTDASTGDPMPGVNVHKRYYSWCSYRPWWKIFTGSS